MEFQHYAQMSISIEKVVPSTRRSNAPHTPETTQLKAVQLGQAPQTRKETKDMPVAKFIKHLRSGRRSLVMQKSQIESILILLF